MFTNQCACLDKWEELLGSSQRTWHDWVGLMPTPFMLISVTSPYGYLNSYDAWFTSYWTCHSTTKLAFCKNLPMSCIVVSWAKTWVACEYIQSTHWLATGYLIGQAWKNRSSKKSSLETNMRTRTFPSQNACRVKADGMGSTYRRRFPLLKFIWYSALVALSM